MLFVFHPVDGLLSLYDCHAPVIVEILLLPAIFKIFSYFAVSITSEACFAVAMLYENIGMDFLHRLLVRNIRYRHTCRYIDPLVFNVIPDPGI